MRVCFLFANIDVTWLFLATWRETSFPVSRPWRRTLAVWEWAAAVLNVRNHDIHTLDFVYSKSLHLTFNLIINCLTHFLPPTVVPLCSCHTLTHTHICCYLTLLYMAFKQNPCQAGFYE